MIKFIWTMLTSVSPTLTQVLFKWHIAQFSRFRVQPWQNFVKAILIYKSVTFTLIASIGESSWCLISILSHNLLNLMSKSLLIAYLSQNPLFNLAYWVAVNWCWYLLREQNPYHHEKYKAGYIKELFNTVMYPLESPFISFSQRGVM